MATTVYKRDDAKSVIVIASAHTGLAQRGCEWEPTSSVQS